MVGLSNFVSPDFSSMRFYFVKIFMPIYLSVVESIASLYPLLLKSLSRCVYEVVLVKLHEFVGTLWAQHKVDSLILAYLVDGLNCIAKTASMLGLKIFESKSVVFKFTLLCRFTILFHQLWDTFPYSLFTLFYVAFYMCEFIVSLRNNICRKTQ